MSRVFTELSSILKKKNLMSKSAELRIPRWIFYVFLAVLFCIFAVGSIYFYFPRMKQAAQKEPSHPYDSEIAKDARDLFQNENALYSYVKKFGPKETVQRLFALGAEAGDCHQAAHKAGRFAYEVYGDKAFQLCSAECHSGCYHGATEAYFRDSGTANLSENLNVICSSELNNFFSHQCIHGVGHGLMAWANYNLPEALKSCDLLSQRQDSCWTGVFMENIVGGLISEEGHQTKYLNNDAQYPCTEVEDKYKSSCYFLQTSRMVQLFGGDFKKIAEACGASPQTYRDVCYQSMGRDVGGVYSKNPEGAINACLGAPEGQFRLGCINGAVQDSFWDQTGQDNAIRFCSLLTKKTEQDACYGTIIGRAPEVLASPDARSTFCGKVEKDYQQLCRERLSI